MGLPIHLPPMLFCPECKKAFALSDELTIAYFKKDKIICDQCKNSIDWWKFILNTVQENFLSSFALMPIGAQSLATNITLTPHKKTTIKFSDFNIPPNAKILFINYTPIGDHKCLFPLEIHGNVPMRHRIPNEISLYPMSWDENKYPTSSNDVSVWVSWVPHTPDDESWENLVNAFEVFTQNRFDAVIIPSNVAVESKLTHFIKGFLKPFADEKVIKRFLSEGAVYSYQLNVLLPMIISLKGLPMLQDHIRGHLNSLRKLRNQLAHDGKLAASLTKTEAAEMLCAALFGFRYLKFIDDELSARSTLEEKPPAD